MTPPLPFQDGFESNDFSNWDKEQEASGCSIEPSSADPHQGTYHALATTDADGTYAIIGRTTDINETLLCSRIYVKIVNFPSDTNYYMGVLRHYDALGNFISGARIFYSGSDWYWRVRGRDGVVLQDDDGTTALATNTWYCLELQTLIDGAAGYNKLYLDGNLEAELTDKDTDNYGNIRELRIGICYCEVAASIRLDCVYADDSAVGCKGAAGLSIPVAMHAYRNLRET